MDDLRQSSTHIFDPQAKFFVGATADGGTPACLLLVGRHVCPQHLARNHHARCVCLCVRAHVCVCVCVCMPFDKEQALSVNTIPMCTIGQACVGSTVPMCTIGQACVGALSLCKEPPRARLSTTNQPTNQSTNQRGNRNLPKPLLCAARNATSVRGDHGAVCEACVRVCVHSVRAD